MEGVTLLSSDCDQELYKIILEAAKEQNLEPGKLQREILCNIFNIPKDQLVKNKRAMLHRMISNMSAEQHIPRKTIARNILRQYFGMPTNTVKKQVRIQKNDNRTKILSFLVIVNAATQYEIASKSGIQTAAYILGKNPWFFERFCNPGDKRVWWRITDTGRQAYFSVMKTVEGLQPQLIPDVTRKDFCTAVSTVASR